MLLALGACGGSSTNTIPDAPAGGVGGGGGDTPPAATASITGKISFEGEVPKPEKLQTSADPNCTKALTTESTVSKDGGLGNVFIYVSGGFEGKSFAPPSTPVELNQVDCHYVPHAIVVSVGQTLNVRNSDMTLHNIHAQTGKIQH
jgi:hypothetical protein